MHGAPQVRMAGAALLGDIMPFSAEEKLDLATVYCIICLVNLALCITFLESVL